MTDIPVSLTCVHVWACVSRDEGYRCVKCDYRVLSLQPYIAQGRLEKDR